jgi:ribonuclease P protein component
MRAKNKISTPLFSLTFSSNNQSLTRFSFIISKKIDKRAVVRNRTKRKIRSVIEEMIGKIGKGKDFVFYLKNETVGASRNEIQAEVNQVFEKNKLLK